MKQILFLLLIPFIAFAKIDPYFSVKKVPGGFMLGVELIDLKASNYNYEWIIPLISSISRKGFEKYIFVPIDRNFNSISVNLNVNNFLKSKENYSFTTSIDLPKPRLKIVRKVKGLLLPLSGFVKSDDYLTFLIQDFSSNTSQISWFFNGTFISQSREISLARFKGQSGLLELKVFGFSPRETIIVSQLIKIE